MSNWPPPIPTQLRPNYKPIPLRWAYHLVLLIFIAGFFAFLEYETRLLPEPGFHSFKPLPQRIEDHSQARRDLVGETPSLAKETPRSPISSTTSARRDGLFTGDIPTTMSTPASASPGIITTDSMPSSASATPSPSSPSDLPVVSTTSPSSLQSSTSVESTAQISTDTEVLVSSSSSLDQGDQDPSTPVVQPNSSPNPLPLPSSGTTTAFTTSPTFQSPTDVHPNSSPRPLPLSSSTTTASTTSQTFPAGAIITRKTSIIAVTSETTLGTSTATSVKAVITNGTTSFTTITTAIPILSTTTSLSTHSEKDFLMASLIPVLLATFLAIPIQIFIKTFNHMVPFRSLRHRGQRGADLKGADARDSLCLSRGGMNIFTAPKISFRFIRRYQDPLPLLSFVLDILTTLLIPLSSETIQIEFAENYCTSLDWPLVPFGYRGPCAKGLRKSIVPSRAAEVFLCLMSAIILVMGFVLWRWRTGVATDPWSVASMTALLSGSSEEVKRLMLGITPPHLPQSVGSNSDDAEVEAARSKDIAKALEGKRFRLGYFQVPSSNNHWRPDSKQRGGGSAQNDRPWSQRGPYQQHMSYGLQLVLLPVVFLVLITGLLILILYYENTILDTPFERFMDSQTYGVRFLFTAMGTGITTFWDYYFGPTTTTTINTILSPIPSTELHALYHALSLHGVRPKDRLTLASVSIATFLSKFAPILLSGVPFRNTVTWKMHETYTWTLVFVLSYMVLVLGVLSFARPPPTSIAGYMYYVCDSHMLRDFEGLSTMPRKARDKAVMEMNDARGHEDGAGGKKGYFMGIMTGVSGVRRVGIDYLHVSR
ncbi:hypothetical protein V8F20_008612 [Naviculisporaceae sp. PSN 640]